MIRNRLYHGLISGRVSMRSLYDDERLKMTMPQACYYCGSAQKLAVDHLIPRIKGGEDDAVQVLLAVHPASASLGVSSGGVSRRTPSEGLTPADLRVRQRAFPPAAAQDASVRRH